MRRALISVSDKTEIVELKMRFLTTFKMTAIVISKEARLRNLK